jgi:heme A synthase
VLVVVQIGLGALNIWWRLSAWSVVPHMIVGASLWTVLVVVALRSRWQADGMSTPPATAGPDRVTIGAR